VPEDVEHGLPRKARDARFVHAEPPLHVRTEGAGGGEAREEHEHGQFGVAHLSAVGQWKGSEWVVERLIRIIQM
jgi:hypothetical protein